MKVSCIFTQKKGSCPHRLFFSRTSFEPEGHFDGLKHNEHAPSNSVVFATSQRPPIDGGSST